MRLIHRHASREKRLILFFLSFPLPMLARWSPLAFDVSTLVFTLFPPPSLPAHFIMPLTAQRIFSKTGLQSPDAQAEDPSGATLGVRTDQRTQRGRRLKVWLKKGQERQWVKKSRRRWSETLDFFRKEVGEGDCFTFWRMCICPVFQLESSQTNECKIIIIITTIKQNVWNQHKEKGNS